MRRLPRHTPLILPVRLSHTFHVAFSDHSSKSRRIQLERGRLVYVCMLKRKTPTHKIAIFTMSESHTLPVQIQIGRSENCNFTFTFCYVLYLFLIAFARRVITQQYLLCTGSSFFNSPSESHQLQMVFSDYHPIWWGAVPKQLLHWRGIQKVLFPKLPSVSADNRGGTKVKLNVQSAELLADSHVDSSNLLSFQFVSDQMLSNIRSFRKTFIILFMSIPPFRVQCNFIHSFKVNWERRQMFVFEIEKKRIHVTA